MIFNHSVKHPQAPPKDGMFLKSFSLWSSKSLIFPNFKGFIRGFSFDTGYLIRVSGDDCELHYVGQSNPAGWIPGWSKLLFLKLMFNFDAK